MDDFWAYEVAQMRQSNENLERQVAQLFGVVRELCSIVATIGAAGFAYMVINVMKDIGWSADWLRALAAVATYVILRALFERDLQQRLN